MDVHTTNYTLCAMEPIIGEDDRVFATIKVTPDYKNILMFIENLKLKLGLNDEYDIQCGYDGYRDWETDRKSTRLNSSHITRTRMPSSA